MESWYKERNKHFTKCSSLAFCATSNIPWDLICVTQNAESNSSQSSNLHLFQAETINCLWWHGIISQKKFWGPIHFLSIYCSCYCPNLLTFPSKYIWRKQCYWYWKPCRRMQLSLCWLQFGNVDFRDINVLQFEFWRTYERKNSG